MRAAQLPHPDADRLHAVAGLRHGRALAPVGGMPQAHAGDVGEAPLSGAASIWPRVGAARRHRRVPDAAVPSRGLKTIGNRRPGLHAVNGLHLFAVGERGRLASNPDSAFSALSAGDSFSARRVRQSRSTNRFGISALVE